MFYFRQSLAKKDRNSQEKTNCLLSSELNALAIICVQGYFLLEKLLHHIYIPTLFCKKMRGELQYSNSLRLDLSIAAYFAYGKLLSITMSVFCVPNWLLFQKKLLAYCIQTVTWIRNIWPENLRPLQNLECFSVFGRISLECSFHLKAHNSTSKVLYSPSSLWENGAS